MAVDDCPSHTDLVRAERDREGGGGWRGINAYPTQVISNRVPRLDVLATQRTVQSVILLFCVSGFLEKGDPRTRRGIGRSDPRDGSRSGRSLQRMRICRDR
jgi:hypothetical protein